MQTIQALFTSYLFALVTDGVNKKFPDSKIYIWDEKQQRILKELECFNLIFKFEFLREFLIVQSLGKFPRISVFPVSTLEPSKTFVLEQSPKPFTMNQDEQRPALGFIRDQNTVQVYNLASGSEYSFESKYEEIQTLVFNKKGDRLAVSNKEGTYVSIHSLPDHELIIELYRGRNPCKIKQMAFFRNGNYFLIHSDRETLHIYDIEKKEVNYTLIPVKIVNIIQNKYLSSFAKYYINPQKFLRKKDKEAFSGDKGVFQDSLVIDREDNCISIIKDNGDYELMGFDLEKGGWGTKLKEIEWFDGWDLIEENIRGLMKVLGTSISRNLSILKK